MFKIIAFLFLSSIYSVIAKADTISYWHVYYNQTKIEMNQFSNSLVTIRINEIKKKDTITVKYFRDTPSSEFETRIVVENQNHLIIAGGKNFGTYSPINFSVFDILKYYQISKDKNYLVYYYEGKISKPSDRTLLFKIKLE
jgi:hypothetical protein